MKIKAQLADPALRRSFAKLLEALEPVTLNATADALAEELETAREREGLHEPLRRHSRARRRLVGADDPDSIARELGGPGRAPAPWLAPTLPLVRAPMRAAAIKAVARTISRK